MSFVGCGGDGGSSDSGTPANVAGTWSGTTGGFGTSGHDSYSATLTLTQDGAAVTGTYTIGLSVLSVTGVVDGDNVVLTGSDTAVRTLDLTANDNTMSGTEVYAYMTGGGFQATVSLTRQ